MASVVMQYFRGEDGTGAEGMAERESGWAHAPLDVLMIIFEKLQPQDLMRCILVNECWRDAVNYLGLHHNKWQVLAQAAMMNRGMALHRRSVLGWRDLYINYRLWPAVRGAHMLWEHALDEDDIRYLHVYKDILIVESSEDYTKTYYHIEKSLQDITTQLIEASEEDYGDDDDASAGKPYDDSENYSFKTDKMIKMLVQESPFTRLLVIDEDCYYMLNDKNILRCIKWDANNKRWLSYVLARYYGCNKSISDISLYNDDVFMLLKSGLVFRLDREGRNFIPDRRFTFMTPAQFEFSRMLYGHVLSSIERVDNLDIPRYSTGKSFMFQRINVVVAVPWEKEFKLSVEEKSGNLVLEYPGLSCAQQHGELVLLGFKDGKVEIAMPKKFSHNNGESEISVNVRDCPEYKDENPEIVAVDVYEALDSHHVFAATRHAVYRLVITYPEVIKEDLGLRKDFLSED